MRHDEFASWGEARVKACRLARLTDGAYYILTNGKIYWVVSEASYRALYLDRAPVEVCRRDTK